MPSVHFLSDHQPLRGEDAVAAIITVEDGRYLMQLRDDISGIFYPGHWGCFGGAMAQGESGADALQRELAEELEMCAQEFREFVTFGFDLTKLGQKKCCRIYFEITTTEAEIGRLVLHEGAGLRLFEPAELFEARLALYDSFALWLHVARHRLS